MKYSIVGLLLTLVTGVVAAQDPLSVGGDVYKLLFENERIRMLEVTFKPGAKIGSHSHPDHFGYTVMGGTLRITDAAGKVNDAALDQGAVLWIPAETHSAENIGPTTIKVIVTELKEPAAKKP